MKIGIDASAAFGWRGPARSTRNTIRALSDIDKENEYFIFSPNSLENHFSQGENIKHICVPKKKGIPWLNVSLPLAVRRFNLDLFFFPANDFWLWKPVKTVVAFRDGSYQLYPKQMFKNKVDELYFRFQMIRLPRIADSLVTVSEHSATMLGQNLKIPKNTIEIVYNGIDPIFFDDTIKTRGDLGAYILFVGGFEFRKNPERLLLAFKQLKQKGLKESLVLVGSTTANSKLYLDLPGLIKKYELEDEVKVLGKSSSDRELVALYKGARLFVFPSIIESFGVPPLEAMACGCPVAAARAGAIPEVVGDAALLFDPYDIGAIANKISIGLKDQALRQELIAKGNKRVRKFSWQKSARKLIGIFNKCKHAN